MQELKPRHILFCSALLPALVACHGGTDSSPTSPSSAPSPLAANLVHVSSLSPYGINCGGAASGSQVYENSEVEPYLAINPNNPSNLIGVWQQDRWSDGGAHGLAAAYSTDGGNTWREQSLSLSICGGGSANYARASDPWVSISPNGTAFVTSISFTGSILDPGATSSVLITRSTDGGATWDPVVPLIADGNDALNDKESVTADPVDSNYVYAVWDRLSLTSSGTISPAYLARSTDGGKTWQSATPIYDPGVGNQAFANEIVCVNDAVLDIFEEIDRSSGGTATSQIRVIRSTDHGATWSTPITVADDEAIGTFDPNTGASIRVGAGMPHVAVASNGLLLVVWQDSRFSGGKRDGIALSISKDGGQDWSAPVQINSVPAVAAFTPSIAVLEDRTIGVSYFDFRSSTRNKNTLITDYWFASSSDGTNWSEQHIAGPFDMDMAPKAAGEDFIGDYQALKVIGNTFVPFYTLTTSNSNADTNVNVQVPQLHPIALIHRRSYTVMSSVAPAPNALTKQLIHNNIMRMLGAEKPGWEKLARDK